MVFCQQNLSFQLLALQAPIVNHMLVKIPGVNFQKELLKKTQRMFQTCFLLKTLSL